MLAIGEEQRAVRGLHNAAAEVVSPRSRTVLAVDDLHVGEPRDLAGLEPGARQRGAPAAVERLGVGKIDGAVLREIAVEDDVQQPALADREHLRHVRERRRELAVRCDDAHTAGTLGHQHAAVGKESKRPGVRQALRDGMDREVAR